MEMIMAMAIGILAASGTWLILRPRTFQVIIGLALLSYAVNLFIFVSGSLNIAREPVLLRFFGSSVRRHDSVGTLLEFWGPEELLELPEIVATLPAEGRAPGEVVPVRLHARVTDIGTLELLAVPVGGSERWKVELQVRTGAAAAGA